MIVIFSQIRCCVFAYLGRVRQHFCYNAFGLVFVFVGPHGWFKIANVQPFNDTLRLIFFSFDCRSVIQFCQEIVAFQIKCHKIINFFNLKGVCTEKHQRHISAESQHHKVKSILSSGILNVNSSLIYNLSLSQVNRSFKSSLEYRIVFPVKHHHLQVKHIFVCFFQFVCPTWRADKKFFFVEQRNMLQTVYFFVVLGSDNFYFTELIEQISQKFQSLLQTLREKV